MEVSKVEVCVRAYLFLGQVTQELEDHVPYHFLSLI